MQNSQKKLSPLAEAELEALEAGREWTRRRIERNLQKLADQQGAISPPQRPAADPLPPHAAGAEDKRRNGAG